GGAGGRDERSSCPGGSAKRKAGKPFPFIPARPVPTVLPPQVLEIASILPAHVAFGLCALGCGLRWGCGCDRVLTERTRSDKERETRRASIHQRGAPSPA
ncbi:unnamed protein product, partial [Scytosiphon promiscuus]